MGNRTSHDLSWYREIFLRDNYHCVYCGRNMSDRFDDWMSLEIDHLIPVIKGEDDSKENRVSSCNICNRLKQSYTPDGYEEMSRSEILSRVREYVLVRREYYYGTYQKAMEEFQEYKDKQVED